MDPCIYKHTFRSKNMRLFLFFAFLIAASVVKENSFEEGVTVEQEKLLTISTTITQITPPDTTPTSDHPTSTASPRTTLINSESSSFSYPLSIKAVFSGGESPREVSSTHGDEVQSPSVSSTVLDDHKESQSSRSFPPSTPTTLMTSRSEESHYGFKILSGRRGTVETSGYPTYSFDRPSPTSITTSEKTPKSISRVSSAPRLSFASLRKSFSKKVEATGQPDDLQTEEVDESEIMDATQFLRRADSRASQMFKGDPSFKPKVTGTTQSIRLDKVPKRTLPANIQGANLKDKPVVELPRTKAEPAVAKPKQRTNSSCCFACFKF